MAIWYICLVRGYSRYAAAHNCCGSQILALVMSVYLAVGASKARGERRIQANCNKLFVGPGCSNGCLLISVSESLAGSILASGSSRTFSDFESFCEDENHKSLLTAKQQQARQVWRHMY